jgi:hypothetical protein
MKWFWRVSIAQKWEKNTNNHQISTVGFQCVACSLEYGRFILKIVFHIWIIARCGETFIGMITMFFYVVLWMIAT